MPVLNGPEVGDSLRQRPSWTLVGVALAPGACLAIWYIVRSYAVVGTLGFPLDDSWIHAQFARNLATGQGFTYTGGQWVSGSTAPGWTVLLAGAYLVLRNIVAAGFALGVLLQLVAGYYGIRLAQLFGVHPPVALMAGTLVVIIQVMAWGAVSGMEVPLAAALVLAGLYYHFHARERPGPIRHAGAFLLGASVLARPENLAVVAVLLAADGFGREPFLVRARRVGLGLLAAGIAIAPLIAFSIATIGRPLPTTFYAKSGPGVVRALETRDLDMVERNLKTHGPRAVQAFWAILIDQFAWGAWLVPLGIACGIAAGTKRLSLTLLAILLVVPFAMGITAPQRLKPDNVRYAAQLVVIAAPLMVVGVGRLVRTIRPAVIVLAVFAVLAASRTVARADEYALSVKNIQELHVTTGRWLAEHLPPESTVAANDVGAIAYFSGLRVLDLEGLVSPDVLPYRQFVDRGIRTVRDMRPDYLAILPGWYPEIAASPEFREIHRISIVDNMIAAGDSLVIYVPPWTRPR